LVYSRFYSSILPARILLAGNAMNGRRQMHRDDFPFFEAGGPGF